MKSYQFNIFTVCGRRVVFFSCFLSSTFVFPLLSRQRASNLGLYGQGNPLGFLTGIQRLQRNDGPPGMSHPGTTRLLDLRYIYKTLLKFTIFHNSYPTKNLKLQIKLLCKKLLITSRPKKLSGKLLQNPRNQRVFRFMEKNRNFFNDLTMSRSRFTIPARL